MTTKPLRPYVSVGSSWEVPDASALADDAWILVVPTYFADAETLDIKSVTSRNDSSARSTRAHHLLTEPLGGGPRARRRVREVVKLIAESGLRAHRGAEHRAPLFEQPHEALAIDAPDRGRRLGAPAEEQRAVGASEVPLGLAVSPLRAVERVGQAEVRVTPPELAVSRAP
jgi:hypothetical protein